MAAEPVDVGPPVDFSSIVGITTSPPDWARRDEAKDPVEIIQAQLNELVRAHQFLADRVTKLERTAAPDARERFRH